MLRSVVPVGNRIFQYLALDGFGRVQGDKVAITCDLPEWTVGFVVARDEQFVALGSGALAPVE